MKTPKRVNPITTTLSDSTRNKVVHAELFYVGDINWVSDVGVHHRLKTYLQDFANNMVSVGTANELTDTKKMRVLMVDGTYATRSITVRFVVQPSAENKPQHKINVDLDKPFGKSHLAPYIHTHLKATAKNMATDKELAKISTELRELNAKVKQLEAKRDELESNRKVATNDHDALYHFGKVMELAFGDKYKFVGVLDDRYCKVLRFMVGGEGKVLPVSVYMVKEQVTKEHNVASSAIVPMPIIHVVNERNVMVPISDLTPNEIMGYLR
jgi:hypothetical protein